MGPHFSSHHKSSICSLSFLAPNDSHVKSLLAGLHSYGVSVCVCVCVLVLR